MSDTEVSVVGRYDAEREKTGKSPCSAWLTVGDFFGRIVVKHIQAWPRLKVWFSVTDKKG